MCQAAPLHVSVIFAPTTGVSSHRLINLHQTIQACYGPRTSFRGSRTNLTTVKEVSQRGGIAVAALWGSKSSVNTK